MVEGLTQFNNHQNLSQPRCVLSQRSANGQSIKMGLLFSYAIMHLVNCGLASYLLLLGVSKCCLTDQSSSGYEELTARDGIATLYSAPQVVTAGF